MSYESAEAAWRTAIDPAESSATLAEWLCSSHRSDTAGPVIRREVWLHGPRGPVADYRLDPDSGDHQVPDWVPRPPKGWDQFPVSQTEGERP